MPTWAGAALKGCRAGKDAAEGGYWTAAAVWNRGIASRAVELLTAWARGPVGYAL